MRELFPEMTDRPSPGIVFCIFAYWACCFVVFPFLLPVIGLGIWDQPKLLSWVELVYHGVNGFVVAGILREYLTDSFFNVQMDPKGFFLTVAVASGMMLLAVLTGFILLYILDYDMNFALERFPVVEMGVGFAPSWLVSYSPLWATICLTLLSPFSVSGLFYAAGFAPMCCRKPWLGYVFVAVIVLLPGLFDILWRGDAGYVWISYVQLLPIHLIACWSYQKADTIWAPILSLAVLNLLTSVAVILLY